MGERGIEEGEGINRGKEKEEGERGSRGRETEKK